MNNIWTVLGLEPTQDVSAVKRAYALKARTCHPEEDPEGFLKLREAYQAALAYAEGDSGAPEESLPPMPAGEAKAEEEDQGWTLSGRPQEESGENPYRDHEAIRSFLDLYTGKQRKNPGLWLDYFTSDAFLDAAWDRRFTALLLEHVTRLEGEYPVNREFLNWLCVAYQFTVSRAVYQNPDGSERTEFRFQISDRLRFDGQESVFEIATKGPAPKHPKGNELAVHTSFIEYRRLLRMAEEGLWSEEDVGAYSQIIGCYAAGYITDKCQQRGDMDYERHPAGLRLMTHFFRREGLPEELYRITWQKLDLKTAVMGRAKLLYGALRELALERLPELAGEQRVSFAKLRSDFLNYSVSTYKRSGERAQADDGDIQKTDAFFAREDFQRALLDRRFVEEEMLHTWVSETKCDYYLNRVIRFYEEHETAPCAQKIIDRAKEMLKYQKLADRLRRDREAAPPADSLTLKNASFFRHWLNTGFYQAQDRDSGRNLLDYLNQELPYLPEWSRAFLGIAPVPERAARVLGVREGVPVPKRVTLVLGEDTVEIRFHLRYMSFYVNGRQVYRPCLPWEQAAALEDTDAFLFLLPIVMNTYDQYETVKAEILRRLKDTAAPEDNRAFIAGCLAAPVCGLPVPDAAGLSAPRRWEEEEAGEPLPPESFLPFEVFAEDEDSLFVCVWFQQGESLMLFHQTPYGRQAVRGGPYEEITNPETAVALARQLLEEQLFPAALPMDALKVLPDAVYSKPDFTVVCRDKDAPPLWSSPIELHGEDVTAEKLEELLGLFLSSRVERLELSWKTALPVGEELACEPCRSLLFLKGNGKYACLYFDDLCAESCALLEKPELYGKTAGQSRLVPFRQGKLFSDALHRNTASIRRRLDVIFSAVSRPNNIKPGACGIWTYAVNVNHGRHKYNLDKQLLGGFPMERSHNRPDALFYFSDYPDSAALSDGQGGAETLAVGERDRDRLQQMLGRFLEGGFPKLRMTWGREAGRRKHIVLLQDGGRFLMAWLLEEAQTAEFHVADVSTYLDVEGKKYPKDTFWGRIAPAYLIHDGVIPLRSALEQLLANIGEPTRITGRFAEYASERPVKPRPYEAIWAELVGDTL